MKWKYIKPLKSEELIREFENTYNFKFPDEYVNIVSAYNGSKPEKAVYDTESSKERTIKSLLSFNKEDKSTIWNEIEWLDDTCKLQYVPFALDEFGNHICFFKADKSIVFLEHESLSIEKISLSFSDFLDKLYDLD